MSSKTGHVVSLLLFVIKPCSSHRERELSSANACESLSSEWVGQGSSIPNRSFARLVSARKVYSNYTSQFAQDSASSYLLLPGIIINNIPFYFQKFPICLVNYKGPLGMCYIMDYLQSIRDVVTICQTVFTRISGTGEKL